MYYFKVFIFRHSHTLNSDTTLDGFALLFVLLLLSCTIFWWWLYFFFCFNFIARPRNFISKWKFSLRYMKRKTFFFPMRRWNAWDDDNFGNYWNNSLNGIERKIYIFLLLTGMQRIFKGKRNINGPWRLVFFLLSFLRRKSYMQPHHQQQR